MKLGQFLNRQALKLIGLGFGVAAVILAAGAMMYAYAEEPAFCGSCHAMQDHYTSWQASTHGSINCVECHLPHDGLAVKLAAKVQTGTVDVYHQTLRDYPLQLEMTDKGRAYLQESCLRCHEPIVADTSMAAGEKECVTCHRNLVH